MSRVYLVSETAQVELKIGRVLAPVGGRHTVGRAHGADVAAGPRGQR